MSRNSHINFATSTNENVEVNIEVNVEVNVEIIYQA
jgi:hypothetical protein